MRATFVGNRPFPLEMLRTDECFPSENDDIVQILQSIRRETADNKPYRITVTKYNDRQWNVDRWRQLGWKLEKLYMN